jgi:hypothetical protein
MVAIAWVRRNYDRILTQTNFFSANASAKTRLPNFVAYATKFGNHTRAHGEAALNRTRSCIVTAFLEGIVAKEQSG